MSGRPVLQSSFEYHVWKSLDGKAFSNGGPLALAGEIERYSGKMNSTVLVMMIDTLAEGGLADRTSLEPLVSKSRSTDCLPSVRASAVLLENGDLDGAEKVLEMSAGAQEMVERSIAAANIALKRGDREAAMSFAYTAYGYDPRCRDAYRILADVDPEGGWPQRENIQDILEGNKPTNPMGEGRVQDLYSIYYDWFTGRRNVATDKLVVSPYHAEKDPEFLLASARMSVVEKDWHSASMVYTELLSMDAPPFVFVEAAEAAIGGADPMRAMDLLSRADHNSRRVLRDIIRVKMLSGSRSEMMDALRVLLDNERTGSEEYVEAVRFLIGRGMDREATALLDKYSKFVGDDPDTLTMRSIIVMRSGDYPSARYSAMRAVRMDKTNTAARAQLARTLYLMDRKEAAERECDSILAQDGDNRDALALLRDLYMNNGDHERAASTCRRLLESSPGDVVTMMSLAISTCNLGDRTAASDMFRSILKEDSSRECAVSVISEMLSCGLDRDAMSLCSGLERQFPKEPMLKRLRGNMEYGQGEYLKASVTYAEAASLNPHNPVLWHSKGMADEARGDLESAEDAYNRALLLDQGEPEYWISKASVQERSNDRYGAIESLNRAIELDPRSVYALVRKAVILQASSRDQEALFYVRQAAEIAPKDVRIMDMESDLLTCIGRPDDAERILTARISSEPSETATIKLARLRLSGGDRDGAVTALDEGLRCDPDSKALSDEREKMVSGSIGPRMEPEPEPEPEPEMPAKREDPAALLAMSVSLMEAGDLKAAMRTVDRALVADPNDPDLYCHKARIAMARGDIEGAAFLAGNSLRTNPNHAGLHEVAALARERKGDLRGALAEADLAIANGLDTVSVHSLKGRVLEAMGHPEMAASSYSQAAALDPDDLALAVSLARQQRACGNVSGAYGTVSKVLRKDPSNIPAIMMKAEIANSRGDADSVMSAYDLLTACPDIPSDIKVRMVRILEDVGCREEARMLVEGTFKPAGVDPAVLKYAEKALVRAYSSRTTADDPSILDAIGLDPEMAKEVSRYLSEVPDIGPIGPDSRDFEYMELQSHEVIMKLRWTDLEGSPLLPLEKVYVATGSRDADAARMLVAYVQKVMLSPAPSTADDKVASIAMGLPKGMTVYEAMKQCDLGVYEARLACSMIV